MNTAPTASPLVTPPVPPPAARKRARRHIPHLLSWLVGTFVLLVLGVMAFPIFGGGCGGVSVKARAMGRAKQIGLALKLFAGDHDGVYPRAGLPGMPAAVNDSNEAFAMLFPTYLTNETIFGNPLSAYQTRVPDNRIDSPYTGKPVRTLEPGENVYACIAGLTDASDPLAPLVFDGTDGTGHYTTDRKKRGGVWEGKQAVVVFLDNSAALATLAGPDHARYIPRRGGNLQMGGSNLLDPAIYGRDAKRLDPAR